MNNDNEEGVSAQEALEQYTVPNKLVAVLIGEFFQEKNKEDKLDISNIEQELKISLTTYLNLNFEIIDIKIKEEEIIGTIQVKDNPILNFSFKFAQSDLNLE